MAFVALIPIELSTKAKSEAQSKFFDCFDITKKEDDKTWYAIKKDLLVGEYKHFLAEFYGLFNDALDEPLDLSKVRHVDTYEEFYEAFYQTGYFDPPCLIKFGDESSVWLWTNTSPRIDIEQAWVFYWACGKISCESSVGGDILGMIELLIAKKLNNPIASALRFAFLNG